jgi:DNA invertase Pin-like site-specific DNA recombinase
MQVLGRIRLSRDTEESSSVERQRQVVEQWAAANGHEVVGWATDVDVSRSVDPFETPELGPWFDRPDEWDIIACWKLDRLATGSIYLNAVMAWCQKNGKTLVSVTENFDLSSWVGRLIAGVIAGVAEGELEAIKERTQASQRELRRQGRWHGGTAPYGYRPERREGGGYVLVVDGEQALIVREIVNRALAGEAITAIADDLNARGLPSPRGGDWTLQTLTRMLRSRWIIGQSVHNGQLVVDSEEMPIAKAEPLISPAEWNMIQQVLDGRARPKARTHPQWPLLGVAACSDCESQLYHHVMVKPDQGQSYRYGRCSGRTKFKNGCTAKAIRADLLEVFTEEHFLDEIGDRQRQVPIYVPAIGNADDIARIDDVIQTVRSEYDEGLYEGDSEGYRARVRKLVERRNALAAEGDVPAHWESQDTGETYREAWERMDGQDRRDLLLESGITVYGPELRFHIDTGKIKERFPGYETSITLDMS